MTIRTLVKIFLITVLLLKFTKKLKNNRVLKKNVAKVKKLY